MLGESLVETGARRTLIVVGVMLATLLQTLDATIVNVALPTIEGNIDASSEEGAWIVTSYLVAAVITIPLTPWFHTRFGRKRFYVAAVAGFTVASAFCGISTSLTMLVVARTLQGLCGGGLVATAQTVLRDTFPPEHLNTSQMLLALGAVAGPSLGPTLGGVLTDNAAWNWVFFINIVPGTLAAVILALFLRDRAQRAVPPRFDGPGVTLLVFGLGALQYVLDQGESYDWWSDPSIALAAVVAAIALPAFVLWELHGTATPVVDLRLLRRRAVASGSILALANGFGLFSIIALLSQFVQSVLGFTATLSGEQVLVRAVSVGLMTPGTLVLLNRWKIDPRRLVFVGFLVVAGANALQASIVTTDSDFWTFAAPLGIGGIGFALLSTALNVSVLRTVDGAQTPKTAAFLSLSQQLGGSLATAVLLTFIDHRLSYHSDRLSASIALGRLPVADFVRVHDHALPILSNLVMQQAAALSFADVSWLVGAVSGAVALLAFLLRRQTCVRT